MNALVIAHAETAYLEPEDFTSSVRIQQNALVFDRISREIPIFFDRGFRGYFLGHYSDTTDSPFIYPGVRSHLQNMIHIPSNHDFPRQFLFLKYRLLEEGIGRVEVCGVTYPVCVTNVYFLLAGRENPNISLDRYTLAGKQFGMSGADVSRICRFPLQVSVREELTDRFFLN